MSKPNDSAVPKWVEEAAEAHSRGADYGDHESCVKDFLAGARLVLDRLKATEARDPDAAQTYLFACTHCGRVYEVLSQLDNDPEYYSVSYLKCPCSHRVRVELPVGGPNASQI